MHDTREQNFAFVKMGADHSAQVKLLHCLREREYLEQALQQGLMFTDHKVKFAPTDDGKAIATLLEEILPSLKQRLMLIGRPFDSLSVEELHVLIRGLGSVSGSVPMICLTEVPDGRNVCDHQVAFGSYGLVLSRQWVEQNGGDRVFYIGQNSTMSRQLFLTLAALKIATLHLGGDRQVLFEKSALRASLDLICLVETRDNLEQAEWRIAGEPGWLGGTSAKGSRLRLPINEIEQVLVANDADVEGISGLVERMAEEQKSPSEPRTTVFPRQLS